MKKTAIIFMIIFMFTSILATPVHAAEPATETDTAAAEPSVDSGNEGIVRFYNFKYENNFLYVNQNGNYYVCAYTGGYEDSNFYFSKTKKLGSGDEIWHINLYELAEKKGYDIIQVVYSTPLLLSDKYLYLPVSMYNKSDDSDYSFLYCVLKIDIETGEYRIEISSPYSAFWLVKKYKGKLYFNVSDNGLCYMNNAGNMASADIFTYAANYSQSSSKNKYIYDVMSMDGTIYSLGIYDLDIKKKIKTIKSVRGYSATDSKIYYGKIVDSRFKVYSANPDGSKAKSVFGTKPKKGMYYELSRVTPKYIYYKAYNRNFSVFPIYYRYSRSTKKIRTLGYTEYATKASDFTDGYYDPVG